MNDPTDAIRRAGRAGTLLVASDFDGTLARIVDHPPDARPVPGALEALGGLAALPRTHVAIISGRSLDDLGTLLRPPPGVALIGSHGAETSGRPDSHDPAIDDVEREIRAIASRAPGLTVERKPHAVTLHYRNAATTDAERALRAVHRGPAGHPGISVRTGKMVIELATSDADKGRALAALRERLDADVTVFLGDDVTDEDALGVLRPDDVGIRIGQGETRASLRLDAPEDAVRFLRGLLSARRVLSAGDAR